VDGSTRVLQSLFKTRLPLVKTSKEQPDEDDDDNDDADGGSDIDADADPVTDTGNT
jgi:hypothetical protein